jgi:hypothetical protein
MTRARLTTGRVARLNLAKGLGDILPDGGGPPAFFYIGDVRDLLPFEPLPIGLRLRFRVIWEPAAGPRAISIEQRLKRLEHCGGEKPGWYGS